MGKIVKEMWNASWNGYDGSVFVVNGDCLDERCHVTLSVWGCPTRGVFFSFSRAFFVTPRRTLMPSTRHISHVLGMTQLVIHRHPRLNRCARIISSICNLSQTFNCHSTSRIDLLRRMVPHKSSLL